LQSTSNANEKNESAKSFNGLKESENSVAARRESELCDDLDHFYVTDAAERFARVAERFLGTAPKVLEAVEIWGHDELHTRR